LTDECTFTFANAKPVVGRGSRRSIESFHVADRGDQARDKRRMGR
jgi:hypothetical protein